MKRWIILAVVCALGAWPSLAASSCPDVGRTLSLAPMEPASAEVPLFLAVADLGPGAQSLTVRYGIGTDPVFEEEIRFRQWPEAQNPVIELLAWHPDPKAHLLARAAREEVTVVLETAAGPWRSTNLSTLMSERGELLREGVDLVETRSTASSGVRSADIQDVFAAAATGCDQVCCYDNCYAYYDQCESGCGTPWDEECLARCEYNLSLCTPLCAECPKVEEWTESVDVFVRDTGNDLCAGDPLNPSRRVLYDVIVVKLKTTRYRKTRYCDRSSSTVVVSVTYGPERTCHRYFDYTCSFGSFLPPPCIKF